MSVVSAMKKIKGISLSKNEDGITYNQGYLIQESPFIQIQQFVDGDTSIDVRQIIKGIPNPNNPETYIGMEELKLLKEVWRILGTSNVL